VRDDGHAVHYSAVKPGTPVFTSDDVEVGRVVHVVDNYKEHILDGFVIEASDGQPRFVDGPDVKRTAELAVTLSISAEEAAQLPPPDTGPPEFQLNRGRLARKLGRGWKRKR
jgi:hypothetical protein